MAKAKTTKASKKGEPGEEKGKKQYADGPDTATLEQPDSTRNQKAVLVTAPADVALRQTNTPSAERLETEDGTVDAYPVTVENKQGTSVTLVEGGGAVATGTLGKTATDKDGKMLRAAEYMDGRFGGKVTVDKDGKATVGEPNLPKGSGDDADRGHGRAREAKIESESKAAAKKDEARNGYSARKSASAKKTGTSKSAGGAKGKKASAGAHSHKTEAGA